MRLPAIILLVSPLLSGLSACRDGGGGDPTPAWLRRRIDSLAERVEAVRGTRFGSPVQGRLIARGDLLRLYDSSSFEEPDPSDTAWDDVLWAVGLVDSLDRSDESDSLDSATIQAFYSRGVLYVVDDTPDSAGEFDITVAHELVHALQDQRWNLADLYRRERGLDRRLALHYLMEGEARMCETLLREGPNALLAAHPDRPLSAYRDTLRAQGALEPAWATIPTWHPYDQGSHALAVRWKAGGWRAIDDWFRRPPGRTSCFLHPERPCPELAPLDLSPLRVLGPEWRLGHAGSVGETYLDILIAQRLGETSRPDAVAGALVQDGYELRYADSNAVALLWRTRWRDESAAKTFLSTWDAMVRRRRPGERRAAPASSDLALFHDGGSQVWDRAERRGAEVWIVEGAPGRRAPRFPR